MKFLNYLLLVIFHGMAAKADPGYKIEKPRRIDGRLVH